MFAAGPARGCLACIYASTRAASTSTSRPTILLQLAASPSRRRCFSSSTPRFASPEPDAPPPPSSSTFSTKAPPRGITTERLVQARTQAQLQLNALLATLNSTARKHGRSWAAALAALELERKLREVGGKINQATGYEEIERLRLGVADREKALLAAREQAALSKKAYHAAVAVRADSQKEVNDLLQRKSSWQSADVLRFTELIQQDHENERAESQAKTGMDEGEEKVEKGFSDLMQSILERYHEEQVWSDKIRSLSTYGSLAITSLNVLLFIITILLVEPWKRKRLVEGVEARLRSSTAEGQEATLASLVSLQSLLTDAQAKLDSLVSSPPAATPLPPPPPPAELPAPFQGAEVLDTSSSVLSVDPETEAMAILAHDAEVERLARQREKEMWTVGGIGMMAGISCSLVVASLGR